MINRLGELDQVFQALGDPTRRAIVERLVASPATVSDLARPVEMSLPAVLQHIRTLESCGVVRSEKVGRVRTCHLEPDVLRRAEAWLAQQRTVWEERLDRLGQYLAPPSEPPTDPSGDDPSRDNPPRERNAP